MMTDNDKAAINATIQKLQDQCDYPLSDFEKYLIEAAWKAGNEYDPPDDPEFNELLKAAVENINDGYRKEGWNAAIAHAEAQHAERVRELVGALQNCIDAIETLPQDVFGVGGDGQTHWYRRDELIGRAKETLQDAK